jgi:hypothetical protein
MRIGRWLPFSVAALVSVSTAAAVERQTEWTKRTYQVVQTGPLPCVGDLTLEVWSQIQVSSLVDGRGGLHVRVHFNTSQFKATDAVGNEYAGAHVINHSLYFPPPVTTPQTQVALSQIRVASLGSGPNLMITERLVTTVNPDGDVTVDKSILSVECAAE